MVFACKGEAFPCRSESRHTGGGDVQGDMALVVLLIAVATTDPLELLDYSVGALSAGVGDV